MTLDQFLRQLLVYRFAVRRGLIVEDRWAGRKE